MKLEGLWENDNSSLLSKRITKKMIEANTKGKDLRLLVRKNIYWSKKECHRPKYVFAFIDCDECTEEIGNNKNEALSCIEKALNTIGYIDGDFLNEDLNCVREYLNNAYEKIKEL